MALVRQWALANVRPDARVPERRLRAAARTATGEWIRAHAVWTHWGTLTFEWAVDENDAQQALWAWLKDIARNVVRDHVRVAWTVERGSGRYGRVHLHVLLAVPVGATLARDEARIRWWNVHRTSGFARLARYSEGRGGPWYMIKTSEWDWGTACPRRFARCKSRCAEDSVPH